MQEFSASRPRLVIVTRRTRLDVVLERHGTRGQADFYLRSRGHSISELLGQHERFHACLSTLFAMLPAEQRRVQVDREELDRFLFAPDDIVVVVGQDGLVPNTAKYLSGQLVIGVNPDAQVNDGVLCRHDAAGFTRALNWASRPAGEGFAIERRSMAQVLREDGQSLLALNEVFIGHRSHQSARYVLSLGGQSERQSSSGIIASTGTGATGWARSLARQLRLEAPLPGPEEHCLAWFVREPWPSRSTGAGLERGLLRGGEALGVLSEMGEGGVVFADGIESDFLEFLEGHSVSVRLAEHCLNLIVPVAVSQQ